MKDMDGPRSPEIVVGFFFFFLRSNEPQEAHSHGLWWKTYNARHHDTIDFEMKPKVTQFSLMNQTSTSFLFRHILSPRTAPLPAPVVQAQNLPRRSFPFTPLPRSCPFLKYGLLFPSSSALITVIPQQDCYSSIVSGQLTFDSAVPPAWSMHKRLSDLLKNDHLVTTFPDPTPPPALNSFP